MAARLREVLDDGQLDLLVALVFVDLLAAKGAFHGNHGIRPTVQDADGELPARQIRVLDLKDVARVGDDAVHDLRVLAGAPVGEEGALAVTVDEHLAHGEALLEHVDEPGDLIPVLLALDEVEGLPSRGETVRGDDDIVTAEVAAGDAVVPERPPVVENREI